MLVSGFAASSFVPMSVIFLNIYVCMYIGFFFFFNSRMPHNEAGRSQAAAQRQKKVATDKIER